MANGFYLTPAEQVDFLDDCKKDANGNMAYGERAADIIAHAIQRALEADDEPEPPETGQLPQLPIIEQAQAEKREKKSLKGENLDRYVSIARRLLEQNQKEVDNGGRLMSKREFAAGLKLDESTVRKNHTLNDIYERFKADNSNVRPSSVNNDPDSFFDDDF